MSRAEQWKNKKIGLVLSGGGAKGAYQIGMFRALEELGLAEQIRVISGTSIGALDGMAYAAVGNQAVRSMMHGFGEQVAAGGRQTSHEQIEVSREAVKRGEVTMEQFVSDSAFSEFNVEMLTQFLRELLPDQKIAACSREVYICAYSLNHGRPEYFHLNGLEPGDQRKLILASASLPFVFPAVEYKGNYYLDGGVIPPICGAEPERADKIPLKPLLAEDLDAILVDFLNPADRIDHSGVPEHVEYLELRPSRPLEKYPGEGTLNFSKERLLENELLGYQDTMKLFTNI